MDSLFAVASRFSDLQILIDKKQELAMIMLYNDNHFQL